MKAIIQIFSFILIFGKSDEQVAPKDDHLIDVLLAIGGESGSARQPVLSSELYDPELNTWRFITPPPTAMAAGWGATVLNNKVYLCGGSKTRDCWIYDPLIEKWDNIAPLPLYLHSTQLFSHSGEIFTIGVIDNRARDTRVARYSPHQNVWNAITSQYSLARKGMHSFAISDVMGTIIYSAGGQREGWILSEFYQYDIYNESYTVLPEMPESRREFKLIHVALDPQDDYLLAIG